MTLEERAEDALSGFHCDGDPTPYVAAAIRRAVLGEREACAARAESYTFAVWEMDDGTRGHIAAAIRARTT